MLSKIMIFVSREGLTRPAYLPKTNVEVNELICEMLRKNFDILR